MEYRRQESNFKTLLCQHNALQEFHMTNGQNTHDQITSDRRSKRGWSNCILYSDPIQFSWKSKQILATNMQCMRNSNLEIRIADNNKAVSVAVSTVAGYYSKISYFRWQTSYLKP